MSRKSVKSISAAGEASPYHVVGVLREASSGPAPPGTMGYHPPAAVNLAAAHGWVTYKNFMSALRQLMEVSFRPDPLRHDPYTEVDDMLNRLARHTVPFAADHRFPDDEVYVCVDRAPVGSLLVRMRGATAMGQAGVSEFFDAVRLTMNVVTGEDGNGLPVLYNRSIFESVFQLQWTCNERQASTASRFPRATIKTPFRRRLRQVFPPASPFFFHNLSSRGVARVWSRRSPERGVKGPTALIWI